VLFLINEAEKLQLSGVNLKDQITDTEPNGRLKRINLLLD